MKSIFVTAFLVFGMMSCKAQTTPADITKVLKFTNDNFDMGKITTGKSTEFNVDILNISAAPVTLDNVMVGCGCTTPKYTKVFIAALPTSGSASSFRKFSNPINFASGLFSNLSSERLKRSPL